MHAYTQRTLDVRGFRCATASRASPASRPVNVLRVLPLSCTSLLYPSLRVPLRSRRVRGERGMLVTQHDSRLPYISRFSMYVCIYLSITLRKRARARRDGAQIWLGDAVADGSADTKSEL